MGSPERWTPEHGRLVDMIVAGTSWPVCAEALGVSVRTVARWLALPRVKQEIAQRMGEQTLAARQIASSALRVAQQGTDTASTIADIQKKILGAIDKGVDVVVGILEDQKVPPAVRLQAFKMLAERALPVGVVVQDGGPAPTQWAPKDYQKLSRALAAEMGLVAAEEG